MFATVWGINCGKCFKSNLLLFLYNQDFSVLQILSLKLSAILKSFIHRVLIRIHRFSSQYSTKAIFLWLSLLVNKRPSTLIMLTIIEIFQISCFLFYKEFETLRFDVSLEYTLFKYLWNMAFLKSIIFLLSCITILLQKWENAKKRKYYIRLERLCYNNIIICNLYRLKK